MNLDLIFQFFTDGEYGANKPTLDKIITENIILLFFVAIIIILMIVGKYAIGEKIFGKKKGWKAIIPFYGFFQLFRAVDLNPYLSIAIVIPLVGLIPLGIFSYVMPKAFGAKKDYQLLSVFLPFVVYNLIGFDKKYEYQYVKGKNVAFKNEFRTVMPEDLSSDALTPSGAVSGAAISPMIAKQSEISRAASAAAEQTRLIREERERQEKAEAERKAAEEAKKKAAKQNPDDFNYDIFDNKEQENVGPESSNIDFNFKLVNGRFKSTPDPVSTPAPAPIATPRATPQPVTSPVATTTKPTSAAPAAPVDLKNTLDKIITQKATTPAPTPMSAPTPAPTPAQPTNPKTPEKSEASRISISVIPPK